MEEKPLYDRLPEDSAAKISVHIIKLMKSSLLCSIVSFIE